MPTSHCGPAASPSGWVSTWRVAAADVWPLAVQGHIGRRGDGCGVRRSGRLIGYFRWARLPFAGEKLVVARSGWSAPGGFEVYLEDASMGFYLWDAMIDAGQPFDIRPGAPNLIDRIEAGLLSYGNDMTRVHSPLECGLDRFCSLDAASLTVATSIGIDAVTPTALGVRRRCAVW